MAYNDTLVWDDLERKAQNESRAMITALNRGLESYNEWQAFRQGRTNAQLATALGNSVDETMVAEMDASFASLKELHDYASNVSATQSDRFYSLRLFSF